MIVQFSVAPVLFVPWEKPDTCHKLLACFGALALSQVAGMMPVSGTLIYGNSYRRKIVNIESLVTRTRQIIDAIKATSRDYRPPAPVLNRHCAICDFQPAAGILEGRFLRRRLS